MKWILIIIVFGGESGAHTNYMPFESKELCETAKAQFKDRNGWATLQLVCAKQKEQENHEN
jgi:hypothetical protein